MKKVHTVDIQGFEAHLPILPISDKLSIAFFNLHGDSALTEHCAKALAPQLTDCDVLITAESKGLQLTHCVARELNQRYYAVVRKTKKGRKYYGCEDNPNCEYMSWNKPTENSDKNLK